MTTSLTNHPPPLEITFGGSQFDKAAYKAYEKVKSERDALKESEIVYKKRNQVLEKEKEDLLRSYQGIYDENKKLHEKVEHGPDVKRSLRFQQEIKRHEEKIETLRSQLQLLESDRNELQKNCNTIAEEKKRADEAYKTELTSHVEKRTNIEKENILLTDKVDKLEKQNREFEHRVKQCTDEAENLTERYKQIKTENLKMEAKFRKQKKQMDEELTDTKQTNDEMAKEIIQLKLRQSKIESEFNVMENDKKVAIKRVNFLERELDENQKQTSQLKKNVQYTEKEYFRLEDELKVAESMINTAQAYGFDTMVHEKSSSQRKERVLAKRVGALEQQVEEMSRKNALLEKEASQFKMKVEELVIENRNLEYSEGALKRRMRLLEDANKELDRIMLKNKKNFLTTMGEKDIRNIEKERQHLMQKLSLLEDENRRMEKLISTLTSQSYRRASMRDDVSLFTFTSSVSQKQLYADMSSRSKANKDYGSRSQPSRSLPDIK